MLRRLRAVLVLGLCLSLSAAAALTSPATGAASPTLTLHVELLYVAAHPDGARGTTVAQLDDAAGPCTDRTYNLTGARWGTTYRWYFRAGSTPASLTHDAAEAAVRRGVGNIVNARNDCGRADNIDARASYQGRTSAVPSCRRTDGHNVIGFRPIADHGVAARACWWTNGGRMVEADVQINSNLAWATSSQGCANRLMLEAVMTHEAGHVFGLTHVGEPSHGRLTMSTTLDGDCNNQESTLGLGDMRGLEALYP